MLLFALDRALNLRPGSNFDIIRMLLNFGADPNMLLRYNVDWDRHLYTDFWEKDSAIRWSIETDNSLQLLKILLEAGATADTGVLFGARYSPLQSAVKDENQAAARILLDYGSNPDSVPMGSYPSGDHRLPLQIAVERQDVEMIRVLFQYRANPNAACIGGDWTEFDEASYFFPRKPLQEASMNGNKEIVEILLEHGADVNSPPVLGNGATALQYAAMHGFLGIAHLLLEHEADVNAPPAKIDGRTALEGAAENGRLDVVQLLLNAGASVFGDGQAQYENAIRRASGNGHHAIRRMLEKWHSDRE
jgi:ankyrin repeat protein